MWVLILFFHVGPMGNGNSNSSLIVSGFSTEQKCVAAGEKSSKLVLGTSKNLNYTCILVQ